MRTFGFKLWSQNLHPEGSFSIPVFAPAVKGHYLSKTCITASALVLSLEVFSKGQIDVMFWQVSEK